MFIKLCRDSSGVLLFFVNRIPYILLIFTAYPILLLRVTNNFNEYVGGKSLDPFNLYERVKGYMNAWVVIALLFVLFVIILLAFRIVTFVSDISHEKDEYAN